MNPDELKTETPMQKLLNTLPQVGRVDWIGLRPSRRSEIEVVAEVDADPAGGLVGDRYAGRSGKRQVTLIQSEHLAVIAALLGRDSVAPELLRRNISVSGLNLLALKDKQFLIGGAVLEFTGLCHPCSFMEDVFGAGGYNAIRGHGGITARVVQAGKVQINDIVKIA
ncbi:MAG TPA: MOSC domain-containing protein [Gammaproteobacteria bacterium]|jgi:MOSC domain-containing protein YiiM|nr:MOSC domain-containing protein [Gammaproteobacteria bacterium]